jgi:hypothetical protein
VQIKAPLDQLVAASEILAWLAATFRCPLRDQLCSSEVHFGWWSLYNHFRLSLFQIRQLRGRGPRTCWQPLFPSSVFALGFPIPTRADYVGLQLPFGVMLDLAGIMHHVDVKDASIGARGIYFKGPRSMLFPIGYLKDAKTVQWHLIWDEDSTLPPGLIYEKEQSKSWVITLGLHELESSVAILGYCRKTAILLGTESRLKFYEQLAPSRANVDRPSPEIALSTATISISAAGFATAQLAGDIKYRKGLSIARHQDSLKYNQLLDSAERQSIILFDTEEKNERAWLVPQLSVILDLVNHWIYQRNREAPIQFASPIADGGETSKTVLGNRDYANYVLRKAILDNENDEQVADLVKNIYIQMSVRAELDAASERGTRGTIEFTRQGLVGWDLLELSQPPMVSQQRRINVHRTHLPVTPYWLPLAKHVPVYFGRRLGELIVPISPATVCDAWFPLPGGFHHNYLAASMSCLSQISKAHGFDNCCLLLDSLAWDYEGDSLFEDCKMTKHLCSKMPQQLVKFTGQKILRNKLQSNCFSRDILREGAVVFSNTRSFCQKVLEWKEGTPHRLLTTTMVTTHGGG